MPLRSPEIDTSLKPALRIDPEIEQRLDRAELFIRAALSDRSDEVAKGRFDSTPRRRRLL